MLNTQKPYQGDRPADYNRNYKRQYVNLRIATINVGTIRGRSAEIVEMLFRRNVDICCVQETVGMAKWLKTFWERTVIISYFGRDMSRDMVAQVS